MSTNLDPPGRADVRGHLPDARARPARARRSTACRSGAFDYLQLVGPAVLAALAAVSVMVITDDSGVPRFHVGVEWLAVLVCLAIMAWRRNLLLGLVGVGRGRGDRPRDRALRAALSVDR